MDIAVLVNYGTLGIWTAHLLWERQKILKSFVQAIDRNTGATEELIIRMENNGRKK